MTKVKALLIMFFIFSSYPVYSENNSSTMKASSLVREYVESDDQSIKKEVLYSLSKLYEHNLDDANIIRMYSGILSSAGDYKEAINVLSRFNVKHKNPSLMLNECMLKDRSGDYDPSCYSKVIELKKGVNDIDYLMALFMINDQSFYKEKRLYMKGRADNQDLDIFKHDKQKILNNLYPD